MNKLSNSNSAPLLMIALVALLASPSVMGNNFANEQVTEKAWEKVGSARLKYWFFKIYDSDLYSLDGEYSQGQRPIALKISYLRNIDKDKLLEHTQDQWEKLGYDAEDIQRWLIRLDDIFLQVEKGDELAFYVGDDGSGVFTKNGKTIGAVEDKTLSENFLNIWLSENTSYPKLRDKLIGRDS